MTRNRVARIRRNARRINGSRVEQGQVHRSMLLRRETRVSGTRLGNLGITVAEFFNSETFEDSFNF